MGIGTDVWEARDNAGLSRDALARKTGLTPRTIFRIEHELNWSKGSLALIAHALNIDPDRFLVHVDDSNENLTKREEVSQKTRSDPPRKTVAGRSQMNGD